MLWMLTLDTVCDKKEQTNIFHKMTNMQESLLLDKIFSLHERYLMKYKF